MSTKIAELTTEMKTEEMEEITISTNVEAKTWHDLYAHVMEGQWGDGLLPGILSASLPGLGTSSVLFNVDCWSLLAFLGLTEIVNHVKSGLLQAVMIQDS